MSQPIPGRSGLRMSLCFRKWSGKRLRNGPVEARKRSQMVWERPENVQKRFGRGFKNVQKWSGKRSTRLKNRRRPRKGLSNWKRAVSGSSLLLGASNGKISTEFLFVRRSCLCAVDQEKAISHWKQTFLNRTLLGDPKWSNLLRISAIVL